MLADFETWTEDKSEIIESSVPTLILDAVELTGLRPRYSNTIFFSCRYDFSMSSEKYNKKIGEGEGKMMHLMQVARVSVVS